jgi:hypothetical protein
MDVLLTRRGLAGTGFASLGIGAASGWTISAGQVVVQTGGLTGVQAYAALVSAIFGMLVGAFVAVGALGGYALGVASSTSRLRVSAFVGGGSVLSLAALLAAGTGGTLGVRPVAPETMLLGAYVFTVGAAVYLRATRLRSRGRVPREAPRTPRRRRGTPAPTGPAHPN